MASPLCLKDLWQESFYFYISRRKINHHGKFKKEYSGRNTLEEGTE